MKIKEIVEAINRGDVLIVNKGTLAARFIEDNFLSHGIKKGQAFFVDKDEKESFEKDVEAIDPQKIQNLNLNIVIKEKKK
jgi:hypothetical protein